MQKIKNAEQLVSAFKKQPSQELAVDLNNFKIDVNLFNLINYDYLKKYSLVPVHAFNDILFVACNHYDDKLIKLIELECSYKIVFLAADLEAIDEVLDFYLGIKNTKTDENIKDLSKKIDEKSIISEVDRLLKNATDLKASDIHIVPEENIYQIFFRIDGILHKMKTLSIEKASVFNARIKIMANLNITEKQLPQDGSIYLRTNNKKIDFRVSLIPTIHGDSFVLRVLDSIENIKQLNEIGFQMDDELKIRKMLTDSGIVLVTGETGSGKSTTIYAMLNELKNKNLNIITVEDPVEYKLTGLRQVQIHENIGYDFANALRSILRHDPDVIVIGEIRDAVTAQIAIQSALTGHLVISTLHTKSAIGSITRLLEIGIEDYLLASVLKGIISQKLIRKLCHHCLSEGCKICKNTGYRGRIPIYELLPISPKIANLIQEKNAEELILNQAKIEGFMLMNEYAHNLINKGLTDEKEIFRKLASY